MKREMQGLLWLFLLEFSLMVMSLEPGFLDFDNLPDTNFSCVGKVIGGYYADLETNCQMFHVCTIGQLDEPMDIRFLCLNGTVFDQETRVCERIDEVDCSKSEQFYSLNLELYGNTQPPILEETPEVEYPGDSGKTSTTVQPTLMTPTSTFAPYFPNTPPTTNRDISKVITSHHFPVNAPDIRFNPEEINISLKAGAPPDITRSQVPISYQQQSFSEKNTRVTVTTHTTIYKSEKQNRAPILSTTNHPVQSIPERTETTLTPKSVVSYGLTHNKASASSNPTEINYSFSFPQTEESAEYRTEIPPHPYQYQLQLNNFRSSSGQSHPYHSSYRNGNNRIQKANFPATTYRNHPAFTSSSQPSAAQQYQSQTEKPLNLQLQLPLLPTLPPLSFSSPSPFSLRHHVETKRYTKEHQSPPRIIISASASVSDNNGRRLNYSLGTIGASHFLGSSPSSYDDYKEEDVIFDPFYHDVPKLKQTRRKRGVHEHDDVIQNEQEAEDLLRYLFNWYKKRERSKNLSIPLSADDITNINYQLAPVASTEAISSSQVNYDEMFRKILNFSLNATTTSTTVSSLVNQSSKNETLEKNGYHLKSKNHTRRSDFLDGVDYNEDIEELLLQYSQNISNEIQQTQVLARKIDNLSNENVTVYDKDWNQNVTTDIPTQSTTVANETVDYYYSEADYYDDYSNPTAKSANYSDTATSHLVTTEIISNYEDSHGNDSFYESLDLETTAMGYTDLDITTLPYSTTVEEAPIFTENVQLNSEVKENVETISVKEVKVNNSEFIREDEKRTDSPTFTISDYVDDNYEPLTYQVHPQVNVKESVDGVTSTPQYDSLTSNFKEVEPTTELEKIVIIDLPKSLTHSPTSVPTDLVTTLIPETTIVSESSIFSTTPTEPTEITKESTTDFLTTILTESPETTTIKLNEENFTKIVTESTTVSSTTPLTTESPESTTFKVKEKSLPTTKNHTSHRFGSTHRKRGRQRFNLEPEPSLDSVHNGTDSPTVLNERITTTQISHFKTVTPLTDRKTKTTKTLLTDAPLIKSANPTKSKYTRIVLSTTPLTKIHQVDMKKDYGYLRYSFNCFNKNIHRFYSDPRDCRLFHYCTLGYTKNQLVDMKFVCDLGTYYDEEKFICTKEKPARCL